MPFVPLTPEEKNRWKPSCTSPEHNPPSHIVIRGPMKWKCPQCGQETIVFPNEKWCSKIKPVYGSCGGMMTVASEDKEHLKDFEAHMK